MSAERDLMVQKMEAYFEKIRQAITAGGASSFDYMTGTVPASGSIVIDAPTILGFTAADYYVYSLGIELRMVDPTISSNPPVVDAQAVLTYQILPNGTFNLVNNFNGVVTYHMRITKPVKK